MMAWQEDESSFVSSVLAAGLAAEQPDRADNPCFGGLFPDRRPSTQEAANRLRPKGVAGFRSIEDARNILAAEDGAMVPFHTDPRMISLEPPESALEIVRAGIAEMRQALDEEGTDWGIEYLLVPKSIYAELFAVTAEQEDPLGPDPLGPELLYFGGVRIRWEFNGRRVTDFEFVLKRKAA